MDNTHLKPIEFWPLAHERIKHWLEARQALLITFCELSTVKDFHDTNLSQGKLLQTFCQQLVDYISEGHFEIQCMHHYSQQLASVFQHCLLFF